MRFVKDNWIGRPTGRSKTQTRLFLGNGCKEPASEGLNAGLHARELCERHPRQRGGSGQSSQGAEANTGEN